MVCLINGANTNDLPEEGKLDHTSYHIQKPSSV